jgi:hypothetical protein
MMPRNPDGFDLKRDILIDPITVEFNIGVHVMGQHRTLNTGVVDIPHDLYPLQGHPPAYTRYIRVAKFSGQLPLSIQLHPHPSVPLKSSDPLVGELINLVESYSHMK